MLRASGGFLTFGVTEPFSHVAYQAAGVNDRTVQFTKMFLQCSPKFFAVQPKLVTWLVRVALSNRVIGAEVSRRTQGPFCVLQRERFRHGLKERRACSICCKVLKTR